MEPVRTDWLSGEETVTQESEPQEIARPPSERWTWVYATLGVVLVIAISVGASNSGPTPSEQQSIPPPFSGYSTGIATDQLPSEEIKPVSATLTEVIAQWRPRIVRVSCLWTDAYNQGVSMSKGSGVAIPAGAVLTNKHVLVKDGTHIASYCSAEFLSIGEKVAALKDDLGASTDANTDSGAIFLTSASVTVQNVYKDSYFKTCDLGAARPAIGDQVVVLGFPGIGSQTNITATEGIISGFDGNYFVTSAKIDHGNSGGAAILVRDNCYLGIPTSALVGRAESLGRIFYWEAALVPGRYELER